MNNRRMQNRARSQRRVWVLVKRIIKEKETEENDELRQV